jgi:hypothetical protein
MGSPASSLYGVSPNQVPYTNQEMAAARAAQQAAYRQSNAQGMAQNEEALTPAEAGMVSAADTANDEYTSELDATTPMGEFVSTLSALPYAAAARGFKENIVGAPSTYNNTPGYGPQDPALEGNTLTNPKTPNPIYGLQSAAQIRAQQGW